MWCHQSSPNERSAERAYGEHLRLASQVTDFMWESLRATLPKKKNACAPAPSPVLFLGEASAPKSVTDVLQGGPKYSLPPNPNPIEKLCIARALADRVTPEERERCISEAVDVLRCKSGGQKKAPRTGPVVSYFQENKLKLLTADKEGGFVVIPEGLFGEKSRAAIQKNFRQVEKYRPRSKKTVLPFNSAHSKLVKRGIASSLLKASFAKSCQHAVKSSFCHQVERLKSSGYPDRFLQEVAETLVSKMKKKQEEAQEPRRRVRPAVIPYIHKVSHNLKKVAAHFDLPVVFSAPEKLSSLCQRINNKQDGVVYEIPMTCGKGYVGQTGRCVNERAREHALSVKNSPSGNLAIHCDRCPCAPELEKTKILGKLRSKISRELFESFNIRMQGDDKCISAPSVHLTDKEFEFLLEKPDWVYK
ncbi:hypothetical protein HPB47_005608 [Ixodes persulcatus]|uniref:Uncharacterized protein n=1 Tax=Ixodes persulcatus TaxID=34615 RepID=A0AC60PCI0_IXOPE|nr:hypothetical protein HPB47_005608 [Ixodes persulcatus]